MEEMEPVVDYYYAYMSSLSTRNSSELPIQFTPKKEALSEHDSSDLF